MAAEQRHTVAGLMRLVVAYGTERQTGQEMPNERAEREALQDVRKYAQALVRQATDGVAPCEPCGGKGVDPACRDETCIVCGGSGVVPDGEIDCYSNGEPFENGPVKCVKDCPKCKGAHGAPVPIPHTFAPPDADTDDSMEGGKNGD